MRSFYGPDVLCPDTGIQATHSPYPNGPWHCMACGATDHSPI